MSTLAFHETHPSFAGTGYEARLLELPTELQPNLTADAPCSLEPVVQYLIDRQVQAWPDLQQNVTGLDRLKKHRLTLDRTGIVVQLNERRSDRAKPFCFLDSQDLPAKQKGVEFSGLFIGVNPFPILKDHLTGIYPEHVDQSIDRLLRPALRLSRALGNEFAVFYNGPMAGASAPRHAHIQAVRVPALPVEQSMAALPPPKSERKADKSVLYLPQALGRTLLAIDSPSIDRAELITRDVIELLPRNPEDLYPEPRMNLLFRAMRDGSVRTLIAPRTAREVELSDSSRTVLRPATIESIGGIIVVSQEGNFNHLKTNPEQIQNIYDRTSLGPETTRGHLGPLLAA